MKREPILIVDDNEQNRKHTCGLLARSGYEVHTASDAEEALTMLGTVMPRLIVMDLQLPGMDGLELTRRLRADPHTRQIAIIMLTGFVMKGDDERARVAGCDDYLSKPLDNSTLPKLVAKYIARSSASTLN